MFFFLSGCLFVVSLRCVVFIFPPIFTPAQPVSVLMTNRETSSCGDKLRDSEKHCKYSKAVWPCNANRIECVLECFRFFVRADLVKLSVSLFVFLCCFVLCFDLWS